MMMSVAYLWEWDVILSILNEQAMAIARMEQF